MRKITLLFALLLSFSLLSACSMFGDDEEERPSELTKFEAEVKLRKQWSVKVGKGQGELYTRLKPVIQGDVIYAASNNGVVMAINKESGKKIWKAKLEHNLSGGVGVGGDLVLLGSENSTVIALDINSGETLWETSVSSEVVSAPATDGKMVVAQSVDGKLTGLDASTGEQKWLYESTVPALSLRGTSSPLVLNNFVVVAFANGSVASIALDNGTLRWEERVAIPSGKSEIERLVDVDGELYVNDAGVLLVSSYQGYLAALDVVTGQMRWRVKESSTVGAGSGFGNVYISDESSHIKAYKTGQEEYLWINDYLHLRRTTAPSSFSNYVAVGDFEGYVHLLSQVDGRFMGRIKVDGNGIRANLLSQNNTLYVYGNSGKLVALKVQ